MPIFNILVRSCVRLVVNRKFGMVVNCHLGRFTWLFWPSSLNAMSRRPPDSWEEKKVQYLLIYELQSDMVKFQRAGPALK
jgi:hypothetical protein